MAIWFLTVAGVGLLHIADDPNVFWAINPYYAVNFLFHHGMIGLVTLGAVFLAVTGGEALYADLGHFGRKPIQTAWFVLVLPCLAINYFGQGALLLADPTAISNPFYKLVPEVLLLPMVILATCATVIASQAVITGAYSLTHQAIQLGLLPRLAILHTSAAHFGQIYIPRVNAMLLLGVMLLVLLFQTSSKLAHAYGIAVDDHDGGRRRARLRRHLEAVAVAVVERGAADGAFGPDRHASSSARTCSSCSKAPGCRCCSAPSMVLLIITLAARLAYPRAEDAPHRGAARRADQAAWRSSRRTSSRARRCSSRPIRTSRPPR